MRISDTLTEILLKRSGTLNKKQLEDLHKQSISSKKPLQDIVIQDGILSESDLASLYADEMNLPFVMLPIGDIQPHILNQLPEHIASRYNAIVFNVDDSDGSIHIAMEDPTDIESLEFLRKLLGDSIKPHLTTPTLLRAAHDQYRSLRTHEQLSSLSRKTKPSNLDSTNKTLVDSNTIASSVHFIIEDAIRQGATDIHIEPHANYVVIRYRIDGLMREVHRIAPHTLNLLADYLKQESALPKYTANTPQQGSWNIRIGEHEFHLRVSVLPTIDGEKFGIHISNGHLTPPSLQSLGLWGSPLQELKHALAESHGLLLVSGPDGSGKSMTRFSMLGLLHNPQHTIVSLEDPIRYKLTGVNYVDVHDASSKESVEQLKSALEQDTNILLLSDLNHKKILYEVVKAARKGHLIIGSMPDDSAGKTIHHILQEGIAVHELGSVLRVVVNQKLVRRLCEHCRDVISPDASMLRRIEKNIPGNKTTGFKMLHELEIRAMEEGLGAQHSDTKTASTSAREIHRLWKAHEAGCERCDYSGYKGRIGIFEVLIHSEKINTALHAKATAAKIEQSAIDSGMIGMKVDGIIKCLRGITSLDEIERVASKTS